ncbi:MAG: IS4/IS5 family transposase, partial [Planctomycetota bacterium]
MCKEVGHTWRERELDPVKTVHMFIHQILNGNTACQDVPRITGTDVTGSAYCQARARLPLEALQQLVRDVDAALGATRHCLRRRHGHRVALLDGSGFSMPDTDELRAHFGQPGGQAEGCGFPSAHLLLMID